jgi:hypothetical protein
MFLNPNESWGICLNNAALTHTQNAAVLVPVIPCLSDPVSALWTIKPCDGLGLRVQV